MTLQRCLSGEDARRQKLDLGQGPAVTHKYTLSKVLVYFYSFGKREQLDKALMQAIFTIALAGYSQCLGAEHNLIWMGKPLYAKDLHCSQNALVCNFQDSS